MVQPPVSSQQYAAYREFWSITPRMGPQERRVVEEHNRLTEQELAGEEGAWFDARLLAMLRDTAQRRWGLIPAKRSP